MTSTLANVTSVDPDVVLGPLSVMSQGFADSFATPLKAILPRPYSLGYAGSPRAFFNELMVNQGNGLAACGGTAFSAATDGTACAYVSYLSYMVIIGVLVPVITVLYCCFFGCGRSFGRCKCMGSCCGQPNCGGAKPTRTEYPPMEKFVCCCCFSGFFLAIWTIGLLGFLSTNQMGSDMQDVLVNLANTTAFPATLKRDINKSLAGVSVFAATALDGINDNLGNRLLVNERMEAFRMSVAALKTSVVSARTFIEGVALTSEAPNPCIYRMNSTVVTYTASGWADAAGNLMTPYPYCAENKIYSCIRGDHTVGRGSRMVGENIRGSQCKTYNVSDNVYTPPGTDSGCACCARCAEIEFKLAAATAKLPSNISLEDLNKPVNMSGLLQQITSAQTDLDAAITQFGNTFIQIESVIAPGRSYLGNQGLVIGASVSIWAFAALSILLGCLGMLTGRGCCWWTSYTCGIFNIILFFALFGASSAIALPFGDLCDGMPRTGEDPTPWLLTFSDTGTLSGVDPLVRNLYLDCLVKPSGLLWSVASLDRNNITRRFDPYDVGLTIPAATRSVNLDTLANTLAMDEAQPVIDALNPQELGFKNTTYLVMVAINSTDSLLIAADLLLYNKTLTSRINAVTAAYSNAWTSRASLTAATDELMLNITRMTNISQKGISDTTDRLMASAGCAILNKMYESVRRPLCTKLSKSLDSTWFLFFLMGIIWFPVFIIICRGSKHSLSRKGVSSLEDAKNPMGGDGDKGSKYKPKEGKESKAGKETSDGDAEKKDKKKKKKKKDKEGEKGGGGGGGESGGGGGGGAGSVALDVLPADAESEALKRKRKAK